MGRKPLGNKETKVRLPPGLPERIDVLAGGKNQRAKFIRDAVEAEVVRQERIKAKKPD